MRFRLTGPSHMRTEFETPNFHRGYEWFMMKEAKKRNPDIKLYALPWEWPLWVGQNNSTSPYTNLSKPLLYVNEWLRGAEEVHNLTLDYVGIWNENECNPDYVIALRAMLDDSGHNDTKIIAPDQFGTTVPDFLLALENNPSLASAVHAVGFHYPDSNPSIPQTAQKKYRLWASEDDSTVDPPLSAPPTPRPRAQPGGACLARTINQNFVQGNLTATIVWNLVMARYPQLRWDYTGLVAATDPFGGHYEILPPVWAAAHTSQFTAPGWNILNVGNGSGWLELGGTYVSYINDSGGFSIVVEKMDADQSNCERGSRLDERIRVTSVENATFVIPDGIVNDSLVLWVSHFGGSESDEDLFVQNPDVPVVNGEVTLEILPNHVYTLSTLRTAQKGSTIITSMGSFPSTYTDDFETCTLDSIPKFIAPMAGSFECVTSSSERSGIVLRQTTPAKSICDRGDVLPYVVIGDGFRTSYNISIYVLLPKSINTRSGAFVGARTKGPVGANNGASGMDGVFFAVNEVSWWVVLNVSALNEAEEVVASGELPEEAGCEIGKWWELRLIVKDTKGMAFVNGVGVTGEAFEIPDPEEERYTGPVEGDVIDLGPGGYASFGAVGYAEVEFDDLMIWSADGV